MGAGLGAHGFGASDAYRKENYVFQWSRPTRWNDDFHEFVALAPLVNRDAELVVTAHIGIVSTLLSRIENEAELWRCSLVPDKSKGKEIPVQLFHVPLGWLAANHGEEKRFWCAADPATPTEEDDFLRCFERCGLPLLESVSSLDGLTELMTHFDEYPKALKPFGFASMDEVGYLAAAHWYSDNVDGARDILSRALAGDLPASVVRQIGYDPDYKQVLECRALQILRLIDSSEAAAAPS